MILAQMEPTAADVGNLIEDLIHEAVRRVKNPGKNRDADIHAIRTTTKHLRAILRLIRPVLHGEVFAQENKRLKHGARHLAFARDFAVGRRSLQRLSRSATNKTERAKFALVLGQYEKLAAPGHSAQCEQILQSVAKALRVSGNRLRKVALPEADWHMFGPGLEKTYRRCRGRMRSAYASDDDHAFHRWRVCVKTLYYQLLLFMAVRPKRLGITLARLESLQNKIGLDHDLTVLKNILQKSPEKFGGTAAVKIPLAHARRRGKKLRRQCRLLGETTFRERPREFVRRMKNYWRTWHGEKIEGRIPQAH